MRAAAVFGLGCSAKDLKPFQSDKNCQRNNQATEWRIGMPAASEQADVVLLFGGDGTVHRHLEQLVRLGIPVLVVPAGSGNDFARALGLRSARDSLAAWWKFCTAAANVRRIDLGVIATRELGARYFCCVAGVGLDAEVARRANAFPRWLRGHGGYALSLLPAIFRFAPFPMKIRTRSHDEGKASGEKIEWIVRSDRPTMLAAFANTPVYGGGMRIAPQAKMDDGQLDVCVIGKMDPFKLACLFPTVTLASTWESEKWNISKPPASGSRPTRRSTSTLTANTCAVRQYRSECSRGRCG
jgi:diacylglycerol kinase family enzyme